MLRVALLFVSSRAVAEEVVQETWLNALRGLSGFQGRSSLKTWLFTILANTARRRAAREARSTPFSAMDEPERFFDASHPRWAGAWSTVVPSWDEVPEDRLLGDETRAQIELELERLPEAQRLVFTLRDIEGWEAEEVCNLLELSDSNQRVILHRARLKVREALERWLNGEEA